MGSVRENRKQKRDNLKIHFDEVKADAERLLPNLNFGGDLKITRLPDMTKMFEVHFPQEAKAIKNFILQIDAINSESSQVTQKVYDAIASSGCPVVSARSTQIPCIYGDNMWRALYARWERLANDMPPNIDFNHFTEDSTSGKYTLIYVDGWATGAVACVSNPIEKSLYINSLTNIARRLDLQLISQEVVSLIIAGNKLLREFVKFRNELSEKLTDIEKFWPTGGRFKPTKHCTRCNKLHL